MTSVTNMSSHKPNKHNEPNTQWCWNCGEMQSISEARVSVLDRGFLFGDGVYEVIPCYYGMPFLLSRHLQRLFSSLKKINIAIQYDAQEIADICSQVVSKNGAGKDQYIYIQITRGYEQQRNVLYPKTYSPTIIIWSYPWDRKTQQKTVRLITHEDIRWKYCEIKSVNLLGNIIARNYAESVGADEVIFFRDDVLIECSASNIFLIKDGHLITSKNSTSMLPGITRSFIISLANKISLPVIQRGDISKEELLSCEEVFISSSLKEITKASHIDGSPLPTDTADWTKKIQTEFLTTITDHCGFAL